ncbi:MAG: hypothetical protein ACYTFY_11250 [Planctomycetota bacterium]|jgi:hypothetical protein
MAQTMEKTKKASLRRRRVMAVTEAVAKQNNVKPPAKRRRVITAKVRDAFSKQETDCWSLAPDEGFMGKILCQPFYSCRIKAGDKPELPFKKQPFVCLINAAEHISSDDFREIAQFLLDNNMRYAICAGIEADRLSDVLNELLEEGHFHENGRTAVAIGYEEDPIEEIMEYFALPSGIAPVNLLVSIGNTRTFKTTLQVFNGVAKKMKVDLSC